MQNTQHSKIILNIFALACILFLGCKAVSSLVSSPTDTPAPTPTDTLTQSPTATDTETPEPTPESTATQIPTERPTQGPPPTVPTDTPSVSHVTFVNNLNASLTVDLKDPSTGTLVRRVTIFARSRATFDIVAGEYDYTISASGYVPKSGTIVFPPGVFTWTWGKAP